MFPCKSPLKRKVRWCCLSESHPTRVRAREKNPMVLSFGGPGIFKPALAPVAMGIAASMEGNSRMKVEERSTVARDLPIWYFRVSANTLARWGLIALPPAALLFPLISLLRSPSFVVTSILSLSNCTQRNTTTRAEEEGTGTVAISDIHSLFSTLYIATVPSRFPTAIIFPSGRHTTLVTLGSSSS